MSLALALFRDLCALYAGLTRLRELVDAQPPARAACQALLVDLDGVIARLVRSEGLGANGVHGPAPPDGREE